MKTKLTTTIDADILKQIKIYAISKKLRLNQIIEEHFKKLLSQK